MFLKSFLYAGALFFSSVLSSSAFARQVESFDYFNLEYAGGLEAEVTFGPKVESGKLYKKVSLQLSGYFATWADDIFVDLKYMSSNDVVVAVFANVSDMEAVTTFDFAYDLPLLETHKKINIYLAKPGVLPFESKLEFLGTY